MSFHVPHQWRVRTGERGTDDAYGNCGDFFIPARPGMPPMRVIAIDGHDEDGDHGWEHVSVSFPNRCPTWEEMCRVKAIFWDAEDAVMQLHPPESEWVNNHPYCLHLWRPTAVVIPLPPAWMVGHRDLGVLP